MNIGMKRQAIYFAVVELGHHVTLQRLDVVVDEWEGDDRRHDGHRRYDDGKERHLSHMSMFLTLHRQLHLLVVGHDDFVFESRT